MATQSWLSSVEGNHAWGRRKLYFWC